MLRINLDFPSKLLLSAPISPFTQAYVVIIMSTAAAPLGRRVVVTGIGIVSPLGVGTKESWSALRKGHIGVRALGPDDKIPKLDEIPAKVNKKTVRCQNLDYQIHPSLSSSSSYIIILHDSHDKIGGCQSGSKVNHTAVRG